MEIGHMEIEHMEIEHIAPYYRGIRLKCCLSCKYRDVDYDWEIYCKKYKGSYTGMTTKERNLTTNILAVCESYEIDDHYQWGFP
jgi:hypothetical protein